MESSNDFELNFHKYLISADINDCMEEPCNNNGTCTDGIADYTCTCPLGYIGTDCEHSMLI